VQALTDTHSNFSTIIADYSWMSWRYSGLALILLSVSLLPDSLIRLVSTLSTSAQIAVFHNRPDDDAETIFARGDRLPLSCVDVSSLELIRGIADTVAFQLVGARQNVLAAYQSGDSERDAFQQVRGVGPATATLLTKYISLEGPCSGQPLFTDTLQPQHSNTSLGVPK
jgi:hypothetical protein